MRRLACFRPNVQWAGLRSGLRHGVQMEPPFWVEALEFVRSRWRAGEVEEEAFQFEPFEPLDAAAAQKDEEAMEAGGGGAVPARLALRARLAVQARLAA